MESPELPFYERQTLLLTVLEQVEAGNVLDGPEAESFPARTLLLYSHNHDRSALLPPSSSALQRFRLRLGKALSRLPCPLRLALPVAPG